MYTVSLISVYSITSFTCLRINILLDCLYTIIMLDCLLVLGRNFPKFDILIARPIKTLIIGRNILEFM